MAYNCEISFDPTSALVYNLSSVFAGLSVLEKENYIKIKKINHVFDFKKSGKYPHRLILELKIEDKIIAIDIADGYQDIHSPEFMDKILDNIDFYFKTSYDSAFAQKLRNKEKFKQFGLLFRCTCPGNVFEKEMAKYYFSNKEYKSSLAGLIYMKKTQNSGNYENYMSCNHYDSYNVMMWTRLWDCTPVPVEKLLKAYPELTYEQVAKKSSDTSEMLRNVNNERIEVIRTLKESLGSRFIGGIGESPESLELAPELITKDERVAERSHYIDTLKSNTVNVLSKGLHGCIGARYGETFAAGRAFLTDKLTYELYGNVKPQQNYIEYSNADSLINEIYRLLDNTDLIHEIEENNFRYYNDCLRPDVLIKRVIETSLQ